MERNFKECLEFVLEREGHYVNDPADPGGATNMGITLAVLATWRSRAVTEQDVARMTRREAAAIYRANYWHATVCEHLPDGIDLLVFDAAVNMGLRPALNLLRSQVGLAIFVKPRTHQSHHRIDAHSQAAADELLVRSLRGVCVPAVVQGMAERRRRFYRSLKTFAHFGQGWLKRVEMAQMLAMRLWVTGGTGIPPAVGPMARLHPRHTASTR